MARRKTIRLSATKPYNILLGKHLVMSLTPEVENTARESVTKKPRKIKKLDVQQKRKACKHQNMKKDGLSTQAEPKQKWRCKDCGHVETKPLPKKAPKKGGKVKKVKTRPAPIKVAKKSQKKAKTQSLS